MPNVGYDDTPMIPGMAYRVHDSQRPQPRVIQPGTGSTPDAPGQPPSDAIVLFDGTDLSGWTAVKGGPATWKVENGFMEVAPGTGDIQTAQEFGDCQLHLEWAAPSVVKGDSQGRGNSGVFLMGRYEIQVLDCYDNPTYADGTTGALYGQYPPLVNACRKPGEWQTYDILWSAPRFEGEEIKHPAVVTVLLNGVRAAPRHAPARPDTAPQPCAQRFASACRPASPTGSRRPRPLPQHLDSSCDRL